MLIKDPLYLLCLAGVALAAFGLWRNSRALRLLEVKHQTNEQLLETARKEVVTRRQRAEVIEAKLASVEAELTRERKHRLEVEAMVTFLRGEEDPIPNPIVEEA